MYQNQQTELKGKDYALTSLSSSDKFEFAGMYKGQMTMYN